MTHASKKPHGCRICEKSYSDARSLRRHYENAHPDEYELWRAAEEAETQLSAVVAAAAAASGNVSASAATVVGGGSSGNNLAQQLVAAKGELTQFSFQCIILLKIWFGQRCFFFLTFL